MPWERLLTGGCSESGGFSLKGKLVCVGVGEECGWACFRSMLRHVWVGSRRFLCLIQVNRVCAGRRILLCLTPAGGFRVLTRERVALHPASSQLRSAPVTTRPSAFGRRTLPVCSWVSPHTSGSWNQTGCLFAESGDCVSHRRIAFSSGVSRSLCGIAWQALQWGQGMGLGDGGLFAQ